MANLKDVLSSIKSSLLARTWTGSSNKVFAANSVAVTRGSVKDALRTMGVPGALVMPGGVRCDPEFGEEPDLWFVDVVVRVFVVAPGEALGENPLMGANRGSSTKSEGAGLLEILEEVQQAIGQLNVQDGNNFVIQFRQLGGSGGVHVDDRVMWLYQDLEFEAICKAY